MNPQRAIMDNLLEQLALYVRRQPERAGAFAYSVLQYVGIMQEADAPESKRWSETLLYSTWNTECVGEIWGAEILRISQILDAPGRSLSPIYVCELALNIASVLIPIRFRWPSLTPEDQQGNVRRLSGLCCDLCREVYKRIYNQDFLQTTEYLTWLLDEVFLPQDGDSLLCWPTIQEHWLTANDGLVMRLVRQIQQRHEPDAYEILHDALLDSGCDNAWTEHLSSKHLPAPTPSQSTCHVIDRLYWMCNRLQDAGTQPWNQDFRQDRK